MLDKFSECPNCHISWNDGDISTIINRLEVFRNKSSNDLKAIAGAYGWTPENPTKFSSVITITIGPSEATGGTLVTFYQCPKCNQVFDAQTEIQYSSLIDAKLRLDEHRSNSAEFSNTSEDETT